MMFEDGAPAAGRTTASMQYKQPAVRVSKTFQDSNIFGHKDSSSATITDQAKKESATPVRISKTYQDSNIFGNKDVYSSTVTDQAKREMERPFIAHKKVIVKPTEINQVFANDDKNARNKLKRAEDHNFTPKYDRVSPSKKHLCEFYGEHHAEHHEGVALRPQSAQTRASVISPKSATEMKWSNLQSNIFTDGNQARGIPDLANRERLMATNATWDSKHASKKSNNIARSDDVSVVQMKAFAQSKKKNEMHSDIFHSGPQREDKPVTCLTEPEELANAKFKDNKNEDIRRTQHMFSDLFGHDEKNYNYKNNTQQTEAIRPTNLAWNDTKTEKLGQKKNEQQTPTERKRAHLSSSVQSTMGGGDYSSTKSQPKADKAVSHKALERESLANMSPKQKKGYEMKSDILPVGNHSQAWAIDKQPVEAPKVYDFDLKSIPQNVNMESLQKSFAGFHVVDLQADHNNINGAPLGTGRVQLRPGSSHDILQLKHDLKSQGIVLEPHVEDHKLKNNYRDIAKMDWHNQHLQGEEGRLKSEFNSAFESKLKNLESEGDIFGNSQGVGKWDRNQIDQISKSKGENGGEQNSTVDVVKTMKWQNTIKGTNGRSSAQPKKAAK